MTCTEEGCDRLAHARTVCSTHYHQRRRLGTLDELPNANEEAKARPSRVRPKPAKRRLWAAESCQVEGCEVPPIARNLCGKHYQRAKLEGTLPPTIRVQLGGVTPCRIEGCTVMAKARGRCSKHAALLRRYGLTDEQMATLPRGCLVCGSTYRVHVDHCHQTGRFRGVLCSGCNTALGLLGDDPARIRALLAYLLAGGE